MRLLHLSDLHFGTETAETVQKLADLISELSPDIAVISGDFTQVNARKEYETARAFMDALPCPIVAVPGNHDVPPFNLMDRFFQPYKRYKRYISEELDPVYENKNTVIAGINSARRFVPHWNWANGAVSPWQREKLYKTFDLPEQDQRWRIVTMHHPIHKVAEMPIDVTVFGRKRTLYALNELKIDVVLTGHVHHASINTIGDPEHQTVYLSAATALSSRQRGQANGFNMITLGNGEMVIDSYVLNKEGHFKKTQSYTHTRRPLEE